MAKSVQKKPLILAWNKSYTAPSYTDFAKQVLDDIYPLGEGQYHFGATWNQHYFCSCFASAQSATRCVCVMTPQPENVNFIIVCSYNNGTYTYKQIGTTAPTINLTLNDTYCEALGAQQIIIGGGIAFFHAVFRAKVAIPALTTIATFPSYYNYRAYENMAFLSRSGSAQTFVIRDKALKNALAIAQGDAVQLSGEVALV